MRKSSVAILLSVALVGGVFVGVAGKDKIAGTLGMLTGKSAATNKDEKGKGQLWTCSMHPQVIQDGPGTCPICQMALEPMKVDGTAGGGAAGTAQAQERKILYWTDPMMNPPYMSDKPGKSPMGMDLVPVYADEHVHGPAVQIDPAVVQNIGLRVAPVEKTTLTPTVRAVGYLTEPDWAHFDVNLRVSGWITKLHANVDGMPIKKGEPLFDLYSPELQLAIDELIGARDSAKAMGATPDPVAKRAADEMVANARRKLELWGVTGGQIESFLKLEKAPAAVRFESTMDGHVTEKMVYEGAAVKAGDRAMRLADNSTLWIDAQVYERDLPLVEKGAKASAVVVGLKEPIEGKVVFFHPHVNPESRTALVRVEIPNPTRYLKQGMYATVEIQGPARENVVVVPREAVIDTGVRQIVFASLGRGEFEPREVKTGLSTADGRLQVLAGLAPGESVVTSGQFLLDSESRLKEAVQKHLRDRLLAKQPSKPQASPPGHAAHTPVAASQTTPEVQAKIDALAAAYLQIAKVLGAKQPAGAEPVNVEPLKKAAEDLAAKASGESRAWATAVASGASGLAGKPLDEQRKAFKTVSGAMISLAEKSPPTRKVAGKLYVVECTMAPGQWLQTDEKVANPYYATSMKACGEVLRTVETAEK